MKWISVSEVYPDKEEKCLVLEKDGCISACLYDFWDRDVPIRRRGNGFWCIGNPFYGYTWQQYLLNPPKLKPYRTHVWEPIGMGGYECESYIEHENVTHWMKISEIPRP